MKFAICSFIVELSDTKKLLLDNHPLVSLGAQLYRLKSFNQWPTSLTTDWFYAISQRVMSKASPDAISLWGVLILGGLLNSLGINYHKIISGIPNDIPSPSSLCYVVKKAREAKFMMFSVFFWNYPCSMSYKKLKRDGLGRMVKEIYFWYVELVQ